MFSSGLGRQWGQDALRVPANFSCVLGRKDADRELGWKSYLGVGVLSLLSPEAFKPRPDGLCGGDVGP